MSDSLYEISIFDYGIPLERYHADRANYNEIAKRLDQTYGRNWTTVTIQRYKKHIKKTNEIPPTTNEQ